MAKKKKKKNKGAHSSELTDAPIDTAVPDGKPDGHQAGKKMISLRVDADVLEYFKSGGPGYQTRMNAVLRGFAMQNEKS